ncbi:MAG: hypothetical protein JSW00_17445 [Thermoplasmata archaeon]|nr:MAG: hypothetical protein JSW00_17445 [Thermoplasmata archaeon]
MSMRLRFVLEYCYLFWFISVPLAILLIVKVALDKSTTIKPITTALVIAILIAYPPLNEHFWSLCLGDSILLSLLRVIWPFIVITGTALVTKKWAWVACPVVVLDAGLWLGIISFEFRLSFDKLEKIVLTSFLVAGEMAPPVGILVSLVCYFKQKKSKMTKESKQPVADVILALSVMICALVGAVACYLTINYLWGDIFIKL